MNKSCVVNNCIGFHVKEARVKAGFSQVELAAIMSVDYDISMDRVQISKIERCIRSVKDKELLALAESLNVSPNSLFGWGDKMNKGTKMEYTQTIDGDSCKINMKGSFTFTDHVKFRKIINLVIASEIKNIELDLNGIDFVDSAGLGLFLLIKDEADKKQIKLTISNPKDQVAKMFKIASFNKLFN